MKKYIAISENSKRITHLKIETYYNYGGVSFHTYKYEERGYYVQVTPVERIEKANGLIVEGYAQNSGKRQLVKAVTRKSNKAQAESEMMAQNIVENMIYSILNENNLKLA